MSRRVCIYGGSFDPPHVCHVLATTWALSALPVDEVWWVPVYSHAFDKQLAPFDVRARMCGAALSPLGDGARVDEIEREMGGTSRTWDTLEALAARHPTATFSLLVGADLVEQLPRWYRSAELLRRWPIHVVGRRGYQADDASELELPDVSSTALRAAFADREYERVSAWVPRGVVDIVRQQRLYVRASL